MSKIKAADYNKTAEVSKSTLNVLLAGMCPFCRDKISEINLKNQTYTHRILCLGCKRVSDEFSFGRAYMSFPAS